MKILQINSVCGVGSTGRIAIDLYKVIEEAGHECIIAYGRGVAPEGIKTIKIGTRFDNYMHVAKTRIFDKHGFGSTKATKEFIKKVEEYDPDVIHLHNIHGYYINIEILFDYLKRANKKVIWTLHDCWAFTGHCSHFDYIGCNKWKNECNECTQKHEYPSSLLRDNSEVNYKRKKILFTSVKDMTIVTPSEWLANLVYKSFLNKYHIKVINNGIDLEIFKVRNSNFKRMNDLEERRILLGVSSSWGERKGLYDFLTLSNILKDDEVILLVGLDEKGKDKLPHNIIGISKTNNPIELAEIYTAADVFINPTREDNFPTVNIESIACGTPCVVYNTGGNSEVISNGCGYVVEKGNINELINKVREIQLLNDSEISNKCRERAITFYNKVDKFKEYIVLYTL